MQSQPYTIQPQEDYGALSPQELLRKWGTTSLGNHERYFIYVALQEKGLLQYISSSDTKFHLQLAPDEHLLTVYKSGYSVMGGFSSAKHSLLYLLSVWSPILLFCFLDKTQSTFQSVFPHFFYTKIFLATLDATGIFIVILWMIGFLVNTNIVLTNKSIGYYRTFLRIIKFQPKWMNLENGTFINNIYQMYYLFPVNRKNIIKKAYLWITLHKYDKGHFSFNFVLNLLQTVYIFEWLSSLLPRLNSNKYFVPIKMSNSLICPDRGFWFEYGFNNQGFQGLEEIIKPIPEKLLNQNGKIYLGLSNMARLALYFQTKNLTSEVANISCQQRYNFLDYDEYVLAILPYWHLSLYPRGLFFLTNKRILNVNSRLTAVMADFNLLDPHLAINFSSAYLDIKYRGQVITKLFWGIIDFPILDLLTALGVKVYV